MSDFLNTAKEMLACKIPDTRLLKEQDSQKLSVKEMLQAACILFALGDRDCLLQKLEHLSGNIAKDDEWSLFSALMHRLENNFPEKKSMTRWLKLLKTSGKDIAYPFMPKVSNYSIVKNESNFILEDVCPSCGNKNEISLFSPVFKNAQESADKSWFCPSCLARREWNEENIRNILWNWYKKDCLEVLERNEKGLLTDKSIWLAISAAKAFERIAPVRFGKIEVSYFGHMIQNTWLYIACKNLKLLPPSLDIIGISPDERISNNYMLEKWKEIMELSPVAGQLQSYVPNTPQDVIELSKYHPEFYQDPHELKARNRPVFSFSLQENLKAANELEKMGLPANAKFVCLHVRDDAYNKKFKDLNEIYNTTFRNGIIDNMRLAAEFLAEKGYYVLRTGADVEKPVNFENSHIIDYAAKYRSEFMDVWLFANCDLCISTSSGPDMLSSLFNRPLLLADFNMPLDPEMATRNALYLPKVFFHPSGQRITIRECAELNLVKKTPLEILETGITVRLCTPQEILAAAKEMLALLDGTWTTAGKIEKHQQKIIDYAIKLSFFSNAIKKKLKEKNRQTYGFARKSRIAKIYIEEDMKEEKKRLAHNED